MTISEVQTTTVAGFAASTSFPAGLTLGNWLFITGAAYNTPGGPPAGGTVPLIGGLTPATASLIVQKASPGSSATVYGETWLIKVDAALAAAKTVAMSFTSDTGAVGIVGWETTGWTGTPTLDPGWTAALAANGTSNAPSSGTSPAITEAPEFIAGWIVGYGQSETTPVTGYTTTEGSGSGYFPVGWRVATSSGGTYVFATPATGSANWAAALYAMYDASGGSTPVSGADTGTGTESVTLTAAVAAGDSGTATDAATLKAAAAGADSAAGTDSATTAAAAAGADTAAGTDAATLKATLPAADSGTGTEGATIAAAVSAADTGTGTDAAGVHAALAGADTGTGAEAAAIAFTGGDTSTGADAASMTAALAAADSAAGADAATVHAAIAAADSGTGADAASKAIPSAGPVLDPEFLAGEITTPLYAGTVTTPACAGAITSDDYAGSIQ